MAETLNDEKDLNDKGVGKDSGGGGRDWGLSWVAKGGEKTIEFSPTK
jgi:hypothetical protein